jgi:hypothetical protein
MRKKVSQSKPSKPKARRKTRRTLDPAAEALREAGARSSEPAELRLVSIDADRAHIRLNRTLSLATGFKILDLLRKDRPDTAQRR